MPNANVKATIRIIGLPNECDNLASESAGIAAEYFRSIVSGRMGETQAKRQDEGVLDLFFAELTNNPGQRGVFLFCGVPKEKRTIDNPEIKFFLSHAKFRDFDTSTLYFHCSETEYP